MTIRQTHTYTPPAGHTNVVSLIEWADTLPPEEKLELHRVYRFKESREKTAIALNKLVLNKVSNELAIYEWINQAAIDECIVDPVYTQYHTRYLNETGINLNIQTETL